jgi:hypothetical protein
MSGNSTRRGCDISYVSAYNLDPWVIEARRQFMGFDQIYFANCESLKVRIS